MRPPCCSGCSVAIFSSEVSRRGGLVVLDAGDRRDFVAEAACIDGGNRFRVAGGGERLHVRAADMPALGDHFGTVELADLGRRHSGVRQPSEPPNGSSKP